MTHKHRWLVMTGLMAAFALAAVACGKERITPQPQPTLCDTNADGKDDVDCGSDPNVTCDPTDGLCKCGGVGGVVCAVGEVCVMNGTEPASCRTDLCATVTCERGMECQQDGSCRCGDDVCGEGEYCWENECVVDDLCENKVCGSGQVCDPNDGICKCGGAICSFGQTCEEGNCVADPCSGKNCGPGLLCNREDGQCHCGNLDGPICGPAQSCTVNADSNPVCEGDDPCADAECDSGEVCNPADGQCYCGGIGPTNPVCASNQTCDPDRAQCLFGDKCATVECDRGLSCDEDNGSCKCGGTGGLDCPANTICIAENDRPACAPLCDILAGVECPDGYGCLVDGTQPERGMHCRLLPLSPKKLNDICTGAGECDEGLHCTLLTDGRSVCRPYCSTDPNADESLRCITPMVCNTLGPTAPPGLGVCVGTS